MENENRPGFTGKPKYTREQYEAVDWLISEVIEARLWENTIDSNDPNNQPRKPRAHANIFNGIGHREIGRVSGFKEILDSCSCSESGRIVGVPAFEVFVMRDEDGREYYTAQLMWTPSTHQEAKNEP